MAIRYPSPKLRVDYGHAKASGKAILSSMKNYTEYSNASMFLTDFILKHNIKRVAEVGLLGSRTARKIFKIIRVAGSLPPAPADTDKVQ